MTLGFFSKKPHEAEGNRYRAVVTVEAWMRKNQTFGFFKMNAADDCLPTNQFIFLVGLKTVRNGHARRTNSYAPD